MMETVDYSELGFRLRRAGSRIERYSKDLVSRVV